GRAKRDKPGLPVSSRLVVGGECVMAVWLLGERAVADGNTRSFSREDNGGAAVKYDDMVAGGSDSRGLICHNPDLCWVPADAEDWQTGLRVPGRVQAHRGGAAC